MNVIVNDGKVLLLQPYSSVLLLVYRRQGVVRVLCAGFKLCQFQVLERNRSLAPLERKVSVAQKSVGVLRQTVWFFRLGVANYLRAVYGYRYVLSPYGNFKVKPFPVACLRMVKVSYG